MSLNLTPIDISTDTFEVFVQRANDIIDVISNYVVTVNSTLGVSVGDGFVEGSFGANLIIGTQIRGGDANTPATLNVISNVSFSESISVGNTVVNSTVLIVGANVVINTSGMLIGNTSVNSFSNSSTYTLGNTALTRTAAIFGNSTVNAVVNSVSLTLSNSTVSFSFVNPTAAQKADTIYFLNANGSWTNVGISPGGSNTAIQFTDSGVFAGNSNFTYDKATNTVLILNTGKLVLGNSTVNTFVNSTSFVVSNSTVSLPILLPTVGQTNGSYFLNANGSWTQIALENPVTGSNTWVQFNDSSAFGSTAGLTFDKTINTLAVGNTLVLGANVVNWTNIVTSTSGTSAQAIASYPVASFRSAEFIVSVKHGSANAYQVSKILTLHDDGAAYMTEFATLQSNGSLGTFTADINAGNLRLLLTPTIAASNVTISRVAVAI